MLTTPSRRTRSRFKAAVVAGAVALAGLCAPAVAQLGLPESVTNPQGALGDAERQQITRYIDGAKAGLSGDAAAISRARKTLLAPFRAREVTGAFRVEYSTQLLPVLTPLAADKRDEAAINATRILGELGTADAVTALAAPLKDARSPVRLVAAKAYEQSLGVASATQTLLPRQVQSALGELSAALRAETEPTVAEAITTAIIAGMHADPTRLPGVRAMALATLSQASAAKAKDSKAEAFISVFALATDAMLDAVNDVTPATVLPREQVPEAVGVAGDVMALAARLDAAKMDAGDQAQWKQVLRQAENLYIFGRQKAESGQKPEALGLGDSFGGDAGKFRRDALGAVTRLTAAPYSLPEDRFQKR